MQDMQLFQSNTTEAQFNRLLMRLLTIICGNRILCLQAADSHARIGTHAAFICISMTCFCNFILHVDRKIFYAKADFYKVHERQEKVGGFGVIFDIFTILIVFSVAPN